MIPKRAFSLEEVKPNEKLYEVSVALKDVPGALAKVSKVLADANINIKTGESFYSPNYHASGFWTSFLDVSKATKKISDIKKELLKIEAVIDVKFVEPKPAPFESIHFPLLHGSRRAIIVPVKTFWALWEGLERILMRTGLEAVLYSVGKRTGEHSAMQLKEKYGVTGKDLILAQIQLDKATGWGMAEVSNLDFKRLSATIIIYDCFEAIAWGKKPYKVCDFTRGYVAGYMSAVFGKPVEAIEVKCLAAGDEYCEFKIQRRI